MEMSCHHDCVSRRRIGLADVFHPSRENNKSSKGCDATVSNRLEMREFDGWNNNSFQSRDVRVVIIDSKNTDVRTTSSCKSDALGVEKAITTLPAVGLRM